MSKVTMQNVADAAGVSRITVWKALTNRAGVSEESRRNIQQKASELGYGSFSSETPHVNHTVAVVVARPESSAFWMEIIHHLAKELALHHFNLMYTYMPSSYSEGYELPSSLSSESVDGFVALNIYDERLLRLLAAQPLPKVFLDTVPSFMPSELNGDLVILEGRIRVREITTALLKSGRRRLGFIGDVNYAQTNYDRYDGFLDAHRALGIAVDPALCMTNPISLKGHYEEISQFLDGLKSLPDGIVCPSDFIAHFVRRYLTETGRRVSDDFVLTGFDNSHEYPNVAESITSVNVETSALGKRLANKLMFRVERPQMPLEVSYVSTEIVYRPPLAAR